MHLVKLLVYLTLAIIYAANVVESFKFLAVLPTVFKSHFIFGSALMKGLARNGHQVYVISPYPQKEPIKNYHDVPFSLTEYTSEGDKILKKHASNGSKEVVAYSSSVTLFALFDSPHVKKLMKTNHTFHAVICEVFKTEALFGFSEYFGAPLIGLSSFGDTARITDMIGSPSPSSYVPHATQGYSDHMNIWQRAVNLKKVIIEAWQTTWSALPAQKKLYNRYFPHVKRDLYTVRRNAAAVLVNTHATLTYSRPYAPNHILVGGLHIDRQHKTLPQDIENFIQQAEHGVIYVSMGTNFMIRDMINPKIQEIFIALTELKQRVLWKHNNPDLQGIHSNLLILPWFPQDAVLAHENVKLFVTQGGRLSTIEAIYYGKPIVGIPVIDDQFSNVAKAAADGIGVELDLKTLNSKELKAAIQRVLTDDTFTKRAKEMSGRYKDQPILPMDLAIHWIEHVARHKGAEYLHCTGLDFNFITYYNLDAAVVLFGSIFWTIAIICITVCLLIWFIRRRLNQ